MPSKATNEATRREWRELGFFYDQDAAAKEWQLVGSRVGLLGFAQHLEKYAAYPDAAKIGEHIHLGPYGYLKIVTSDKAQITSNRIAGSPGELARLAETIRAALSSAIIGTVVSLRASYSPDAPFDLILDIRDEEFDPASEDADCW